MGGQNRDCVAIVVHRTIVTTVGLAAGFAGFAIATDGTVIDIVRTGVGIVGDG